MLASWFDRLLGRARPLAPPPRGSVRSRPGAAAAGGPASVPPDARRSVPVGAHRPLIGPRGQIAGFEFRLGDGMLRRLRGRGDSAAAAASIGSLLGAMRTCAQNGQAAYGEVPAAWLLHATGHESMQANMFLALNDDDVQPAELTALLPRLQAWRAAGAQLGWRAGSRVGTVLPAPDFQVLPTAGLDAAALVAALRANPGGLPLIALDLPGIEALEAALRAGVRLACCHIDSRAEPPEARPLTPQTQRLLKLMNQLARDADTPDLVAAIKADVSLSYRLLRQLNSAAVCASGELGSIEQAVALLGRNELYRWVSVLLVRQAPARPASAALQAMALARARFFELLAEARGEPQPGALFTLGLASMLPLLLQTPLPDALAALQLHPQAALALLERQGPWCAYLALAEVLDESDLEEAAPLAEAFGGLQAVMAQSTRAWAFGTTPPPAEK
ncbi:HDOD domain-containing protein [Aquabacterium sp.]|uniref:HDOD domain-containing protein n=1 Tax=Aquabacterium sp. TaxID=1872578 RepID=UPI003784CD10